MSHAEEYHVPDFEADAKLVAEYEDGKERHERREILEAENQLRTEFSKKRELLKAELNVAGALIEERRNKAQRALDDYAGRYRHRVVKGKAIRPSGVENLFSFGAAGRLYTRAVLLAQEVENAQTQRRRKEHEDEVLDEQLKRRVAASESALRIKHASQEGIDAFHKRPGMAELWKKVEAIRAERESYRQRLEREQVSFPEQRDREWALEKIDPLEPPFDAVLLVRVACYGNLSYLIFRDLEKRQYHLTYDPRLLPLSELVVDAYRIADRYELRLHKGDKGRAFNGVDFFMALGKAEEAAREEFRQGRAALRELEALPEMPVGDDAERQLVELLATFVRTTAPTLSVVAGEGSAQSGSQSVRS